MAPTRSPKRPTAKAFFSHPFVGLAVLSISLGLAACASDKTPPPPCPEILIAADGAKLTRFKPGPGTDIIDVLHEEELTGFAQGCEYDIDKTGAGTLTVLVAPTIMSSRGPANQSNDADFEYIIAITDLQKTILKKYRYPLVLPYQKDVPRIIWQRPEPHAYVLPLSAGQTGENFLVYISLQLNRSELEYQRKNR